MSAIKHADDQWWDIQAGEYVLGSLSARERELFENLMCADADIREQVCRWQQRFAPLNEMSTLIVPPEHIWANVLAHVSDQAARNEPYHDGTAGLHDDLSRRPRISKG